MIGIKKIFVFFNQVIQEFKKVAWPERNEVSLSVLIITLAVIATCLCVMALDVGIHGFVSLLLSIGK